MENDDFSLDDAFEDLGLDAVPLAHGYFTGSGHPVFNDEDAPASSILKSALDGTLSASCFSQTTMLPVTLYPSPSSAGVSSRSTITLTRCSSTPSADTPREGGRLNPAHLAGQRFGSAPLLDPHRLPCADPDGVGGQHVDRHFHVPRIAHFQQRRARDDHPLTFLEKAQHPAVYG